MPRFFSGKPAVGTPVPGGTSGSVVYIDVNGNLAQNNANFFWDATNHRLGIGTAAPAYPTEVAQSVTTLDNIVLASYHATDIPSGRISEIQLLGSPANVRQFEIRAFENGNQLGSIILPNETGSRGGVQLTYNAGTVGLRLDNSGNVGIGESANASSRLDVASTTSGFLPPRMTTTQKNAISSPAEGLVVYNTTLHKLCIRTASAWETITSA